MNLFILSLSKRNIAKYMIDKHISKIILEAVQMLCTAARVYGDTNPILYKLAHKNHPVTKWCRASLGNYLWTIRLIDEMHKEWQYRYQHQKIHKSYIVAQYLRENPPAFEHIEMTPFALAMPEKYKTDDPIESYRNYYMSKKFATWKNREKPYWFIKTE